MSLLNNWPVTTTESSQRERTLISWSFDTATSREFVPSLPSVLGRHESENIAISKPTENYRQQNDLQENRFYIYRVDLVLHVHSFTLTVVVVFITLQKCNDIVYVSHTSANVSLPRARKILLTFIWLFSWLAASD